MKRKPLSSTGNLIPVVQPLASHFTDWGIRAHLLHNYYSYYYYYYSLSPPCRVFTIIYLKKHDSEVCNFAAILYVQFILHVMQFPTLNVLYICISTFRSMCAVPSMTVLCSSLMSCFPGMLLRYFLNDFEMVLVASINDCNTFVFAFHICCTRWHSLLRHCATGWKVAGAIPDGVIGIVH